MRKNLENLKKVLEERRAEFEKKGILKIDEILTIREKVAENLSDEAVHQINFLRVYDKDFLVRILIDYFMVNYEEFKDEFNFEEKDYYEIKEVAENLIYKDDDLLYSNDFIQFYTKLYAQFQIETIDEDFGIKFEDNEFTIWENELEENGIDLIDFMIAFNVEL